MSVQVVLFYGGLNQIIFPFLIFSFGCGGVYSRCFVYPISLSALLYRVFIVENIYIGLVDW